MGWKNQVGWIAIAAGAGMISAYARAAVSPDQFYCDEAPIIGMAPIMYDYAAKDCPGGKGARENLCTVPTTCLFLTPEFEKDVRQAMHLDFRKLSPVQRKLAIQNHGVHAVTFGSLLTCGGRIEKGTRICPIPENCKHGDLMIKPNMAFFDNADNVELSRKFNAGETGYTNYGEDARGARTVESPAEDSPTLRKGQERK
jgi:hypothetical protein